MLDTYHTFTVNDKLTLAVEADYVIGRVFRDSPPSTVWGGVGMRVINGRRNLPSPVVSNTWREKVSPAGGLFSGVTQALKEHTLTAEYKLADGFMGRASTGATFPINLSFSRSNPEF